MHAHVPYCAPERLSGCKQTSRRSELKLMMALHHREFSIFYKVVLSIYKVHLHIFIYGRFYSFLREPLKEGKSTVNSLFIRLHSTRK